MSNPSWQRGMKFHYVLLTSIRCVINMSSLGWSHAEGTQMVKAKALIPLAAASLLSTTGAIAQAIPAEGGPTAIGAEQLSAARPIEEVVVSAQRRETVLSRTAVSATAFSGEQLRSEGIATFDEVATRYDYHAIETGFEPYVFRALLSLKTCHAPSDVTRFVKGNLATSARKQLALSDLWSRGWFFRSVGHLTNDTARQYISNQYDHHNATPVERSERVALGGRAGRAAS